VRVVVFQSRCLDAASALTFGQAMVRLKSSLGENAVAVEAETKH